MSLCLQQELHLVTQTALILVVDDNEMNRDMLTRRLQRQGYDVIAVEDGFDALKIVHQYKFDLILLDIMMPKVSGYQVLEQLKTDPRTRHLPVIMISAVDDLDSVVRCIEMGAEDYLFKPFNPVLLKARVGAILSRKQDDLPDLVQQAQRLYENIMALHQLGPLNEAQAEALDRLIKDVTVLVDALRSERS